MYVVRIFPEKTIRFRVENIQPLVIWNCNSFSAAGSTCGVVLVDLLSVTENLLGSADINNGWGQIDQRLVIAFVAVVLHKLSDHLLDLSWRELGLYLDDLLHPSITIPPGWGILAARTQPVWSCHTRLGQR